LDQEILPRSTNQLPWLPGKEWEPLKGRRKLKGMAGWKIPPAFFPPEF